MAGLARELSREVVEVAYNGLEPVAVNALPSHVEFDGVVYTRLSTKTPQTVSTLFGPIELRRVGYRPTEKTGEPTIFPLARELGIVAGASPALAERASFYQGEAGATQGRTLMRLKCDHDIGWGVKKLRRVVGRIAAELAAVRHDVQAAKLGEMLGAASRSSGPKEPVLCVGRDGISLGLQVCRGTMFEVASAGTVTVFDRNGNRLGTLYLARTPESGQKAMTDQLRKLLNATLGTHPLRPRLCYVTDAGDNETKFFNKVLRRMRDPRTGERLSWTRVVDFYHASQRLTTMGESLFGVGPEAIAWARRMRALLKRTNGVRKVLASAAALRKTRGPAGEAKKEFERAYHYLRSRTKFMRYWEYEKQGIPRGSGITEAACKTVYTQRLKLSGMRWKKEGAQTILDLRIMQLSGVWETGYERIMTDYKRVQVPTNAKKAENSRKIAA